jgi:hypothetical protein
LRAVIDELLGGAFAGIDDELGDGLAEKLAEGELEEFVGDIEGVEIDHFPDQAAGSRGWVLALQMLSLIGEGHTK